MFVACKRKMEGTGIEPATFRILAFKKNQCLCNVINFTNGDRNPRALDIYYELWDGSIYPEHSFTPNMTA